MYSCSNGNNVYVRNGKTPQYSFADSLHYMITKVSKIDANTLASNKAMYKEASCGCIYGDNDCYNLTGKITTNGYIILTNTVLYIYYTTGEKFTGFQLFYTNNANPSKYSNLVDPTAYYSSYISMMVSRLPYLVHVSPMGLISCFKDDVVIDGYEANELCFDDGKLVFATEVKQVVGYSLFFDYALIDNDAYMLMIKKCLSDTRGLSIATEPNLGGSVVPSSYSTENVNKIMGAVRSFGDISQLVLPRTYEGISDNNNSYTGCLVAIGTLNQTDSPTEASESQPFVISASELRESMSGLVSVNLQSMFSKGYMFYSCDDVLTMLKNDYNFFKDTAMTVLDQVKTPVANAINSLIGKTTIDRSVWVQGNIEVDSKANAAFDLVVDRLYDVDGPLHSQFVYDADKNTMTVNGVVMVDGTIVNPVFKKNTVVSCDASCSAQVPTQLISYVEKCQGWTELSAEEKAAVLNGVVKYLHPIDRSAPLPSSFTLNDLEMSNQSQVAAALQKVQDKVTDLYDKIGKMNVLQSGTAVEHTFGWLIKRNKKFLKTVAFGDYPICASGPKFVRTGANQFSISIDVYVRPCALINQWVDTSEFFSDFKKTFINSLKLISGSDLVTYQGLLSCPADYVETSFLFGGVPFTNFKVAEEPGDNIIPRSIALSYSPAGQGISGLDICEIFDTIGPKIGYTPITYDKGVYSRVDLMKFNMLTTVDLSFDTQFKTTTQNDGYIEECVSQLATERSDYFVKQLQKVTNQLTDLVSSSGLCSPIVVSFEGSKVISPLHSEVLLDPTKIVLQAAFIKTMKDWCDSISTTDDNIITAVNSLRHVLDTVYRTDGSYYIPTKLYTTLQGLTKVTTDTDCLGSYILGGYID